MRRVSHSPFDRRGTLAILAVCLWAWSAQAGAQRDASDDAAPYLAQVRRLEYRPSLAGQTLQAPNRRHGFRTYFEPKGIRVVERRSTALQLPVELALHRFGRGTRGSAVPPGAVVRNGEQVEIRRAELVEWFRNSSAGLEHGFTLGERPPGEGPLFIELTVTGARVHQRPGTRTDELLLRRPDGRTLVYGKLHAVDARGVTLATRMLRDSEGRIRLEISDRGARYPLVIDPLLTALADAELASDEAGSSLGFIVDGAGDVNGDGFDDVIVGANSYDSGAVDAGAAFVFLGGPDGIPDATPPMAHAMLSSDQTNSFFGNGVTGAGDVNGDGFDDVIVGASSYSHGEFLEGAAFLYLGSPTGITSGPPSSADARFESNQVGARFGFYVAGIGDINDDGYDDIGIGADSYDDGQDGEGAVFVYLGSASGIPNGTPSNAHAVIEADQANAFLGIGLAGAGDVNGDGIDDLIVGAWLYDAGAGRGGAAFIFHGSPSGIQGTNPATADTRLTESQNLAFFGRSVAGAGDVNGDGFDDVIVAAFEYDAGETDEGAAFVFLGSATGIPDAPPAMPQTVIQANQAGAFLGHSVDSAGDFDGDGYDDILIGAHEYVTPSGDGGVAFVFRGSAAGVIGTDPASAFVQLEPGQAASRMAIDVARAGDVNGDGISDLILGGDLYDTTVVDAGAALIFLPEPGLVGGFVVGVLGLAALAAGRRPS